MDLERDESANRSSNSKTISILSDSSLSSRNSIGRSVFTVIDTNITSNTEIQVVTNIWVNMFKENPKTGTIKLFAVIMNCFDVDVCDTLFTNFNSNIIFTKIMICFKTLAKTDSLLSPETIKKSLEIQKTLKLMTSIFRYHNTLFFTNGTTFRSYFIFLRDILIKISQSDFIGPRLLSTYFGLKIITGLIQSNNLEFVRNNLNILFNEFLIKRWKDTSCSVREIVLLELQLWIQIDPFYFLNDFWMYVYWALGDQSASIQIIALETSKIILNMNSDIHNVKLLIKKIVIVMANLLLSKNEEVVISAFTLYSILPSIEDDDDDDEQYMLNVESLILELILSEKSNVARVAAKHFVDKMVNSKPYGPEQLKVLLVVLDGIPSHMITIATSFFVDAIYDLCPVLTDFELISQILTLDNYIEKKDKCNLMVLLTYVVKWLITGIKPEQNIANMGDQNDVTQLHINTLKKREYTTYITMHLLIQLKECENPTHAFSLWILLQFVDFELLKDKMIISDILRSVSLFYQTWNIPTVLEMVSKCIHIMTSNVQGYEKNYCLACIQNIAHVNINILKAGVENSHENTPNLLNQKDALIKLWSLSKYNHLPDDLEPLKYLSYYIPYLNSTQSNLVVSKYALNAYMEILRKELLKVPTYSQNDTSIDQYLENTFFSFLDAIFNILCKYDPQVVTICETAFLIVDELLRVIYSIKETYHVLNSNQNKMLADFIFNICGNIGIENNNDSSTLKLINIYIQLIQDGFIDMNHLLTLLQFVKMESFEHALRPTFKFFCKKQTGDQFSCVINQYLIYMFENIISQNSSFKDSTIKDVIDVATIITRLLCQCGDQIGKRLVSTNIHRHGIQYAMCDLLNNPYCSDYPFKHYFWVLASMCDTLIPYDAQRLADYFLDKSTTHELINSGNEHVLRYLYKLQELCDTQEISFSSET